MGHTILDFTLPAEAGTEDVAKKITRMLSISDFSYTIEKKSLDARKKTDIRWVYKVLVEAASLPEENIPKVEKLNIPDCSKNKKNILVIGSGPSGFFAAYTLQKAGFSTTIIEQGSVVAERDKALTSFEKTGVLDENNNYTNGEGGAGTFSDGKLTSRTKTISLEKKFIFDTYIEAGAPKEIEYLASPHIGSDILKKVVPNLRSMYEALGGKIIFNTKIDAVSIKNGKAVSVSSSSGQFDADEIIFATGHSSFETYRMLNSLGVKFQLKPFAIGARVEHSQELINRSQWGKSNIKGIKGSEYKLTFNNPNSLPVYSFCMCPGGRIVPSTNYKNASVVNGMSNYMRNSNYANSGIVAGFKLDDVLQKEVSAMEALDWLSDLETQVFSIKNDFSIPALRIADFISGKIETPLKKSSYPFPIFEYDFGAIFPKKIYESLQLGLKDFSNKIRGFETGLIMGLETKTSSPIQTIRDEDLSLQGFANMYFSGEGSGHSGGIVSSGADGIKTAFAIIKKYS